MVNTLMMLYFELETVQRLAQTAKLGLSLARASEGAAFSCRVGIAFAAAAALAWCRCRIHLLTAASALTALGTAKCSLSRKLAAL
jgi:hypothetical protein